MDFIGQVIGSCIVFLIILGLGMIVLSHPWVFAGIAGIIASGVITFFVTMPDEDEVE